MPELTPRERLQPCLLDRLTDEDPDKNAEGRDRRVFSVRQVRKAVLRDLSWLLNCPAQFRDEDLERTPRIASSVLNFGVPDLCGTTSSGLDLPGLERAVSQAVKRFEPRIIPSTLKVRAIANESKYGATALVFEITGDLWAEPVPEPLYLQTAVDLETGGHDVQETTPR